MASELDWQSMCTVISLNLIDPEEFKKIPHSKKVVQCYSNAKIKNYILSWMETNRSRNKSRGKTTEESKRLRDLGNQKYAKADVEGSLKLYTESIICAPHSSREMLLALGNRSAASFRLRNYEDCIADIDFAIENFQDEVILPKLITRKQDAIKKLELGSAKPPFSNSETELSQTISFDSGKSDFPCGPVPSVSRGQNVFFPFASTLLKLETDQFNYRRVIANEDIEVGEILFVEDPFTFVLRPDYFQSNCQFCSAELKCPLACSDCNNFLFCNQTCFKRAYDTFHKWECPGSHLLIDTGIGFLALRTLLKASQDPFSLHYEQVNNLESHLDDVSVDNQIANTVCATLLLLYLEKYTDFFTSSSAQKSIDGVGFRLLKHINQIICNAFSVKKSHFQGRLEEDSFETCLVTFSSGLYPSAAMMNHSCDPNIITSFYYKTLVIRANQKIHKGEEVFNCYGPHYLRANTEKRKENLKSQYHFDCGCKQCALAEGKWTNFVCLHCASSCTVEEDFIQCSSCTALVKQEQYDELMRKAESIQAAGHKFMKQEKFEKALPIFEKAYHFLLDFLNYSSPEVETCSSNIDICQRRLFGMVNWRYFGERAKLIKCSSGKYSDEYGEFLRHSLGTYLMCLTSQVPLPSRGGLSMADLAQYTEELERIAEYNFGPWSSEYAYVKDLKNSLVKYHRP